MEKYSPVSICTLLIMEIIDFGWDIAAGKGILSGMVWEQSTCKHISQLCLSSIWHLGKKGHISLDTLPILYRYLSEKLENA